jgi:hypothetical protein
VCGCSRADGPAAQATTRGRPPAQPRTNRRKLRTTIRQEGRSLTTKISTLHDGVERPHVYANTYTRERLSDGSERLRVGLRGGHAVALRRLAALLPPPYKLLYVLHTSRTGAVLGRYESDVLDGPEVEAALARFGNFFAEDARHDIWLHSAGGGTLVLDRHNVLNAYGPLDEFETALQRAGIAPGAGPQLPSPHALHYHAAWDDAEQEATRAFGWRITPLRPEDRQFDDSVRTS